MNAFASYIRHLLVTGILFLVEKWHLPIEGSADAANWIALSFIGTLTWVCTKYGKDLIPLLRGANLFLLSIALAGMSLGLSSCGWPVTVGVRSEQYGIGGSYSAEDGLNLNVDADKIIDRESGK